MAHTCNAHTNNRRQVEGVSPGFPARRNDKTIIKFDDFITGIKTNVFCNDKVLTLKEWNGEEIVERS